MNWRGDPDGPLRVTSETLALELRFEDERMRLWDPETREYLLEHQDEHDGRMEERAGRMEERDKRIAAEQRARDLETRLADLEERLRKKP